MPKARVVKGGWSWKGEPMVVGQIIDAPSDQWIANRIADGGLVEAIDAPAPQPEPDSQPEAAAVAPAETTTVRPAAKRKA